MTSNEVSFRLFKKSDIEYKVKWINDPSINKYLHYDLPLCPDRTLNWFNKIMSNSSREDYIYEVNVSGKMKPIGLIGLLDIDQKNNKAEFYIVNGEKEYWGKGISTKVMQLFLKEMFLKRQLNKIYLYTEVDNKGAQKVFEKLGFKQEGLLKEDLIYRSRKIDRLLYAIHRKDFFYEES